MRLLRERRAGGDRRATDRGGRRALERRSDELRVRIVEATRREEWEPVFAELQLVRAELYRDYERRLRRAGLAA